MKKLLAALTFFIIFGQVKAVITVRFNADTTRACSPAQINFSDSSTSTNGPIVYWIWDFGNGGQSNLKNPSRAYTNSGFYTITLKVSDGIDTTTLTKTNYLQILKPPVAAFAFNELDKCKPILAQFFDRSTPGDANVTAWEWDYGDLTPKGTVKNPTHKYGLNGTYTVILKVTDANGCRNEVQRPNIIVVKPPIAAFTGTNLSSCSPPLTTGFSNTSSGKGNLKYSWTFGDGGGDSVLNPVHTYSTAGSFNVTLIVTDTSGCKDTLSRVGFVNVGQTKADFNINDTLCANAPSTFVNTSSGATSYLWDFAGLATSLATNPSFSFPARGNYTIQLIASAGPGCTDTISKTIYVDSVVADFTFTQDSVCSPEYITLKDNSFGANSYTYTASGLISFAKDTAFRFSKSFCANTSPVVTYRVSNANCADIITKPVGPIYNSAVSPAVTTMDSCAPALFQFSQTNCVRFKSVSYSWNFGTGNPGDTSNLATPNGLTVNKMGEYTATVTIVDSAGCVTTSTVDYKIGEKTFPSFTWTPDSACWKGPEFVLTNTSTDTNKITAYQWHVNDTTYSNYQNKDIVVGKGKRLGWNKIQLKTESFLCISDTIIDSVFFVGGPALSARYKADCLNPYSIELKGNIGGGSTRFYWSLGDTSQHDSINLTIPHLYPIKDTIYRILFWAIDDSTGCEDSVKINYRPIPVNAVILPSEDTLLKCTGTYTYYGSKSYGVFRNNHYWDFGNGVTQDKEDTVNATYNTAGKYQVRLIVMSKDSCFDTAYKHIHIYQPTAGYTLPSFICNMDSATLIDTSISELPLTGRNWRVNGVYEGGDSIYTRQFDLGPNNTFPKRNYRSGIFNIALTVVDSIGCSSTINKRITVEGPEAEFTVDKNWLCRGDTVFFTNALLNVSGVKSFYKFGDGDTTSSLNPFHIYKSGGTFNPRYIVNGNSCVDSISRTVNIQAIDSMNFMATLTDTTCYPATTYFSDLTIGDSIISRTWDFGDGGTPITSPAKDSLTKTYFGPGRFTVKLIVETSLGCKDSIEKVEYINVTGPFARYSLTPDSICAFDETTMRVDTLNQFTRYFQWDFANGRLDSTDTNTRALSNRYYQAANLLTVLIFSDSSRSCVKFESVPLAVLDVTANFDFSPDSIGCAPYEVSILDSSLRGSKWSWDFSNGEKSNVQNPKPVFKEAKVHTAKLVYENSIGCRDTLVKNISVFPTPIIKASADTIICLNDSAQLYASGAISYLWSPKEYLGSPSNDRTGSATPSDKVYVVEGTDINGCKSKDTVLVRVMQVPELEMPFDTTIIIGERFVMRPTYKGNSKFSWTPKEGLSCPDCPNPFAQPLVDTRYTLVITDSLGCFPISGTMLVNVEQKFSVDVPDAFTPNGDGENDLIFPNGWGMKEVLDFKIFNRWGELVFEASHQIKGWDGYYKGELQNMDTYIYFVKAVGFDDEIHTKEGYITLLR